MKYILIPIAFLVIWVVVILILGGKVTPDLRGDGGYEPARGVGHPLWQDY